MRPVFIKSNIVVRHEPNSLDFDRTHPITAEEHDRSIREAARKAKKERDRRAAEWQVKRDEPESAA